MLSQNATTRPVSRLEDRGPRAEGCGLRTALPVPVCPTDRRGICTDVTTVGPELPEEARSAYDAALCEALDGAAKNSEPAPLVAAVEHADAESGPSGTSGGVRFR